ncbi:hypothetical protein N4R57_13190 [Rhodobacteraceae bacterium D3-12]|nr:hypothetical protein N4R57_13190 [Rhodobacteraceae bacterium D3-12]
MSIGARLGSACLLAALWTSPSAKAEQATNLTLPQARAVAISALREGRPQLAYSLSKALLKANPRDASAYFVIARSLEQMRDPKLGRRAAGYAFRYSKTPNDRFLAAQMAARLSYQAKQYNYAQYWLRRSIDSAPDDRLRQQTINDFKRVSRENPLRFNIQFSLAPSDNVNSGTDNDYSTADGLIGGGVISDDGQPLSGVVAKAGLTGPYRLHLSKTAETRLTAKLQTRQVFLTSEARAKLQSSPFPSVQNKTGRDFSSTTLEMGVAHSFVLGQTADRPRGNGFGRVSFSLGQQWYAQDPYSRYAKVGLERGFTLAPGRSLRFGAFFTRRDYGDPFPSNRVELRVDYAHAFENGAQLGTGVMLARTSADGNNRNNDLANLYVTYRPAKRIGPAKATFTLAAVRSDYPGYLLLNPFPTAVPGGRRDNTLYGAAAFQFDQFEFAGFSPELLLSTRQTTSNVSRFDTSEVTLSIGIKSSF